MKNQNRIWFEHPLGLRRESDQVIDHKKSLYVFSFCQQGNQRNWLPYPNQHNPECLPSDERQSPGQANLIRGWAAIADGRRPTLQLIMQTDNAPIYGVTRDDLFEVFREFYEKILEETQNEADQKMISVKEAAYMLDVDRSTLWRWEKKGYLIPDRIGRKVLYRMADIKKIINLWLI